MRTPSPTFSLSLALLFSGCAMDLASTDGTAVEGASPLRVLHGLAVEAPMVERGEGLVDGLFPVIEVDGTPYLVLSDQAQDHWGVGPVELLHIDPEAAFYAGERAVDDGAIPEDAWRRLGERVELHGLVDRGRCTADVVDLRLLRRTHVDDPAVFAPFWDEDEGDVTVEQAIRNGWALSPEQLLVGRLSFLDGECDGRSWAHPLGVDPGRRPATDVLGADREVLIEAFRALPEYQERNDWFIEALADQPDLEGYSGPLLWDRLPEDPELAETPSVRVTRFAPPGDQAPLFVVRAEAGWGFCGGFYASLWAVFEEVDGVLSPRLVGHEASAAPDEIVDVDGDGEIELIGLERFVVPGDGGHHVVSVEAEWMGCPC